MGTPSQDSNDNNHNEVFIPNVDNSDYGVRKTALRKKPAPILIKLDSSSRSKSAKKLSPKKKVEKKTLKIKEKVMSKQFSMQNSKRLKPAPKNLSHLKNRKKPLKLSEIIELDDVELDFVLSSSSKRKDHHPGGVVYINEQPRLLSGGVLREHQMEGLNWLANLYTQGINGILADEMGLGKTVQTISLICWEKEAQFNEKKTTLILAPKSTLGNWTREFHRFAPTINVLKYHGAKEERESLNLMQDDIDVVIATYEMVIVDQEKFERKDFSLLVIDEAHRLKNEESKLIECVRSFNIRQRILLTGTPLQNNLRELWALLNFLFPKVFVSADEFREEFTIDNGQPPSKTTITGEGDDSTNNKSNQVGIINDENNKSELNNEKEEDIGRAKKVERLHRILSRFMLRRDKASCMRELKPKRETLLKIPMSKLQKEVYKTLLQASSDVFKNTEENTNTVNNEGRSSMGIVNNDTTNEKNKMKINNLCMELRKCCNHPYLFDFAEDKSLDPFGEHLVRNSGKLCFLDRLLQKKVEAGHKVLIFSQFVSTLDILDDYLRLRGFRYCRIDGQTADRDAQIDSFQNPENEIYIFILSTRAGGLGINLTAADTVVIFDSDWNPQMDLQAIDRAHRIGQTNEVTVYRLIHPHTIEEKIAERAKLKLQLDQLIIKSGTFSGLSADSTRIKSSELLKMVQSGMAQIFETGTNDLEALTDEDYERIFKEGEEESFKQTEKLNNMAQRSLLDFRSELANSGTDVLSEVFTRNISCNEDDLSLLQSLEIKRLEEGILKRREKLEASTLKVQYLQQYNLRLSSFPNFNFWHFCDFVELQELIGELKEILNDASESRKDLEDFKGKICGINSKIDLLLPPEHSWKWSKMDFLNLVRGMESLGKDCSLEELEEFVPGKSKSDIRKYQLLMEENESRLPESIRGRLIRSEADLKKKRAIEEGFRWKNIFHKEKTKNCNETFCVFDPSEKLETNLIGFKKGFSKQEDDHLILYGDILGVWAPDRYKIHYNIDINAKYNWLTRSRNGPELRQRIDTLGRHVIKEMQEKKTMGGKN